MSRKSIYPVFLPHAGCPHRCLYCEQTLTGATENLADPVKTLERLDDVLPSKGEGELAFYGGSFTLLEGAEQEEWLGLGARLIAQGRIASLRISTRPDAIDSEIVERLLKAGVSTVELGCQSFDDEVLRQAKRGHGAEAALRALPLLQSQGIAVGIHLMPGLPGAGEDEAMTSLAAALALRPDFLRIHPTVVLRGTPLEGLYRDGLYVPLSLAVAVQLCAAMFRQTRRAAVPVIRFGLMANEKLDGGDAVVAGPYHPAFGQLVRSRLWFERISVMAAAGCRSFRVHPADLADLLGQRRSNMVELNRQYGTVTFECAVSVPRETIESQGRFSPLFSEE